MTHLDALMPIITARLEEKRIDEWLETFRSANVPCGPINTVERVFEDPQIRHRDMLRTMPHPLSGEVRQVVSPLRFANAPLRFDRPPPLLGEHTAEVLEALGLTDDATT